MFEDLLASGAPPGPLGVSRTVYRVDSSRGKVHLQRDCRDGLVPLQRRLMDLDVRDLCRTCQSTYQQNEAVYLGDLAYLADRLKTAERVINAARADGDQALRWKLLTWRWLLIHPERTVCTQEASALRAWAVDHLVPRFDAALAAIEDRAGGPLPADWALRIACTDLALGGPGDSCPESVFSAEEYPALVPPSWSWSARRSQGGQAQLPMIVREAIRRTFVAGASLDQAELAGLRAGLDLLAAQEGPDELGQTQVDGPVPGGDFASLHDLLAHVWRDQAAESVARLCHAMVSKLGRVCAEQAAEPVRAYEWRIEDRGYPLLEPAATVCAFAVARVAHDQVLAFMPPAVALRCRAATSVAASLADEWGPVAPGDTVATYETAAQLLKQAQGNPAVALDLARLTEA